MKEEVIIKKKLENSIMPQVLMIKYLAHTWDNRLYHLYSYSKEIITLCAGYGLSSPILHSFGASTDVPATVFGASCAAAVGFFRFRAGNEDTVKRVLGQKKIARQFRGIQHELNNAIQLESPNDVLTALIPIQQQINATINNAIQEDIVKQDILLSNGTARKINEKAKKEADDLIQRYHSDWEFDDKAAENIPDQK